jgi:hypothetical protein
MSKIGEMPALVSARVDALREAVAAAGFAFVHSAAMRHLLESCGPLSDWHAFGESWNRLQLDTYMADGGRYRRRRHATFAVATRGPINRLPPRPHFQSLDYNPLNGGVARWFEPVEPDVGACAGMQTILEFCRRLFGSLAPEVREWLVEVHQFRIEAREGEAGRPTPEGLHRDGVDYVLVLLVRRSNIRSGVTSIHALNGAVLGSFTLADPFDAAIVDDTRVAHGVTPVEPIDPALAAHRDVLVVTFARTS